MTSPKTVKEQPSRGSSKYRLRDVAARVSSVHPLFYIVVYFAMIPAFAAGYYIMPAGSFYAPYVRLEPTAAADLTRIGSMIEVALHRSLESREIVVQGCKLNRLVLMNTQSRDGLILNFDIMGVFDKPGSNAQKPDGQHEQPFAIVLPAALPTSVGMLIGPRPDETANIMRPVIVDVSTHPPSFQSIEMEFYDQLFTIPFFPLGRGLVLTRHEDQEVTKFFNGLQGNPIAVSKAFPRMLYFSAIVITTVGFGDIVPMTPVARLCVALQAVFGVTLAGVFLTAIAYRASHSSAKI
jgi:Ion channel